MYVYQIYIHICMYNNKQSTTSLGRYISLENKHFYEFSGLVACSRDDTCTYHI